MIRSFTALISVFLLASMMYAQNAPEAPAGYRAELTRGSMYTGFHWTPGVGDFNGKFASEVRVRDLNNDGTLTSMSLYGINYGYFISTGWAIEGVIDFGSTSTEADVTNNKFSATEFGITALIKYYFQPKFEDVTAWLGAGILFGSISQTLETPNENITKIETSGSSLGIGLDFGAQYFIANGFALAANYQLGFSSMSKPETKTTSTEGNAIVTATTKDPSITFFGTMTGSLGINFYF